ncbi:MAG: phosphatidylserine/phosphatidylglycerophosphate/cardiolipin synthase family protein [Sphingomonadales bacterium]|nr:phosphatidylserine/phosphatidylglycerophosphate/cardiolipin synthase family protein [Sphingomonadales bacterium]MBD3774796.1 phosphatidylserine/phosphatidylglycerophosphate/cardiolipin synthase family protein [Paracoccaceae bacterium]
MASTAPFADYRDPDPFVAEVASHRFTLYPAGCDRLDALLEMIGSAQHSLELAYYMFLDDAEARRVRDALAAAARRGVSVAVIVDRFGTDAPDGFFAPITAEGGRFAFFSANWNLRYLIRNHQKFVIADGSHVMIGGANVARDYFAAPQEGGWTDLSMAISGPVVADFSRWFVQLEQWTATPGAQLRALRKLLREWDPGEGPVQLLLGGPTRVPSSWARRVKRDLLKVSRLDMVMAYFSPPRSYRRAMARIARRGQARLVMASKSDNGATIGAARLLYRKLLRAGVAIYEFLPAKLHMKLIVADDATYVGSANFDMRSLRLNLELMLRVEDAGFAAQMRGLVDTLAGAAEPITPAEYRRKRSWLRGWQWRLSWFLVSVVDYTVTRRLNFGLDDAAD